MLERSKFNVQLKTIGHRNGTSVYNLVLKTGEAMLGGGYQSTSSSMTNLQLSSLLQVEGCFSLQPQKHKTSAVFVFLIKGFCSVTF